jgi:ATP-dependent Clp protease adaptor protein ClpS
MEWIMSETHEQIKTVVKIEPRLDLTPPSLYRVIYLNDNVTSMEFVVQSIVEIFEYDEVTAEAITMQVHDEGSATVAVMSYEMAEQKGLEVTHLARSQGFPLQVKLEPEN